MMSQMLRTDRGTRGKYCLFSQSAQVILCILISIHDLEFLIRLIPIPFITYYKYMNVYNFKNTNIQVYVLKI